MTELAIPELSLVVLIGVTGSGKSTFALRGKNVRRGHGLDASLEQLAQQPEEFRAEVDRFIDGLISHYVLDGGRLVVAHAGLIERYQGRASGRVREFCLYGQTTGETDEYGLPVRHPWAQEYRGRAMVLYGHMPVPEPEWLNNTLCLDTGCVFGGRLTALNYPERTLVSVPAARVAAEKAGLFDELDTSWLLLDAELLPWNVKAGQLLRDQYAAVGAAARMSLPAAVAALEQARIWSRRPAGSRSRPAIRPPSPRRRGGGRNSPPAGERAW